MVNKLIELIRKSIYAQNTPKLINSFGVFSNSAHFCYMRAQIRFSTIEGEDFKWYTSAWYKHRLHKFMRNDYICLAKKSKLYFLSGEKHTTDWSKMTAMSILIVLIQKSKPIGYQHYVCFFCKKNQCLNNGEGMISRPSDSCFCESSSRVFLVCSKN